jgi:hypothetical protein
MEKVLKENNEKILVSTRSLAISAHLNPEVMFSK